MSSAQIASVIEAYQSKHPLNAQVIIAKGDKVKSCLKIGFADVEQQLPFEPHMHFPMASISKQFIAVGVLLLAERGKINLEAPLINYLTSDCPIWHGGIPAWASTITIHHLLIRSSGLPEYHWKPEHNLDHLDERRVLPFILSSMKDKPLLFKSGEEFEFCNMGYLLLAAIIEKISDEHNLTEFFANNIFTPLHMHNSFFPDINWERTHLHKANKYQDFPTRYVANMDYANASLLPVHNTPMMELLGGAAGLVSNSLDLITWQQNLYKNKVLNANSLKLMTKPHLKEDHFTMGKINYGYGLFIDEIAGRTVYRHGGWLEGIRVDLSYIPKLDTSVVLLSNISPSEDQQDHVIYTQIQYFWNLATNIIHCL